MPERLNQTTQQRPWETERQGWLWEGLWGDGVSRSEKTQTTEVCEAPRSVAVGYKVF